MKKFFIIIISSLLSFFTFAHDNNATDKDQIKDIIKQIEYGWENGDGAPFKKHFFDFKGARYFESGGQNVGLSDLIEHHVEPEKDALVFLSLDFSNIQTHVEDDFAWTLVDTTVQGKVRKSGETFNKTGFQTFLFKKVNGEWLIVHTHSSSRNRAKD